MTLLRFLGFPRAVSFPSRGLPTALLLALILCLGAPSQESAASEFQVLKYFTNADGAHSFSELVQGSDGTLYGTTVTGNNSTDHDTIFKLNPDGSGFTVLKNFDSPTTGGNCWGGLLLGSDGVLYGTTSTGGTGGAGSVFKLNPDGTGFAVLKNFDAPTTGGGSYAPLVEVDQVLYGTTYLGGNGNAGTVFKLNPNGSGFAVLKHFDNSTTGGHPTAGLILGPDGVLYGTAAHGGSFLFGTIFKLKTSGSAFGVIKHLDGTTGGYPQARLLLGSDGALYGAASDGGSFDAGTLFTLNPDGSGFTVLKSLHSSTEGAFPTAGLIEANDGKLYGTTLRGGTYDWGVLFEIDPDGTGYRVLKRFDYATSGGFLYGGLMQGSDGALYGAAAYGWDDGFGTLFRLLAAPNQAPTAVATADFTLVTIGEQVTFDGSASTDPDGDELTYAWTLTKVPRRSQAALTNPNTAYPTLQPDQPGTYKVTLTVTDCLGAESSTGLAITATDP
jgi:uncharacterized repeat protein (TIGR03803 family)